MQSTYTGAAQSLPSANGIQVDGGDFLAGFEGKRHIGVLTAWGTFNGTTALTPKASSTDSNGTQWLPIAGAVLTAAGQVVFPFVGEACRVDTTGTEANTINYELEILTDEQWNMARDAYFV